MTVRSTPTPMRARALKTRTTAAAATWQFHPEKLKALTVPPTLVGVLQARLDALPGDERRTAQLASVVGMRFWDASLAALGAPPLTSLQGLLGRELAAEMRSDGAPLGLERDPGHEAEGLAEVAEGEPARDRLLLLVVLPVRQLQLGQLLAHLFGTQYLQLLVGWQLQLVSHLRPPCRR